MSGMFRIVCRGGVGKLDVTEPGEFPTRLSAKHEAKRRSRVDGRTRYVLDPQGDRVYSTNGEHYYAVTA